MSWNLTEQSDRFKIKYGKLADKVFNAANPVTMQIQSKEDFVGKQIVDDNPLGFSGSVGSGVLPKSNSGSYANSILTSKKIYATVVVDRESKIQRCCNPNRAEPNKRTDFLLARELGTIVPLFHHPLHKSLHWFYLTDHHQFS
jgi:hypothetical protein